MRLFFAMASLLALLSGRVLADWPCRTDSTIPISTNAGNQWNVHVASDGKSGAIFVWQDRRGGTEDKLYYQAVNASGVPQWIVGGVQLASTAGFQYYPQIMSDGAGGAFIVWQDNRYGVDYDIFVQRISSSGVPIWFPNGTLVCNAAGHQYNPQLISDGSGGIIVTWQDKRSGNFDIYAQRFDKNGQPAWAVNGVAVTTAPGDQVEPKITTDGQSGAIIAWTDYRSGTGFSDIYAQRVLFNGVVQWMLPDLDIDGLGFPVCRATNTQWNLQIVSDGSNGAIIVWQDRRAGTYDNIYGQRVNSSGTASWAENGIPLAQVSGMQYYPQVISDGGNDAIVVWQDNRTGTDYDIYAQRVTKLGQLVWPVNGKPICTAIGHQYNPQIVSQGTGGVIVTWQDRRTGDFNINAQCLNASGIPQWDANGVGVTTESLDQFSPQLASDGVGGAIVAWADYHLGSGSTDIFAQRLGANGLPAGGCYRTFTQAGFAQKAVKIRNRYTGAMTMPNEGNIRDSTFGRGAYSQGVFIGIERLDNSKRFGWEYFSRSLYIRHALPQNGTARPFDRIGSRFFVGQVRNPGLLRYNNKLVGELLALKLNIAASDVGLIPGGLGDLVFKDTSSAGNILNNRTLRKTAIFCDSLMTLWTSYHGVDYGKLYFWLNKINTTFAGAFDTVSTSPLLVKSTLPLFSVPFLVPSSDPPTSIPPFQEQVVADDVPGEFVLLQNYPNPFNPLTTIEFILPEPAIVSLKVYNILGQEIASIINNVTMDDGRQIVDFDASKLSSGVYFYQLIAEKLDGSGVLSTNVKKMMLLR
jgi:hypothetical protein